MLAARGISMGIGKDINLSGLTQLKSTDRALICRMQRLKDRQAKAKRRKIVVRKHIDNKVIFGAYESTDYLKSFFKIISHMDFSILLDIILYSNK